MSTNSGPSSLDPHSQQLQEQIVQQQRERRLSVQRNVSSTLLNATVSNNIENASLSINIDNWITDCTATTATSAEVMT